MLSALFLTLGSCQSSPPAASRTVTDDLGRTLTIPDTVRQIVTLAPSLTEVVFAAGAGSLLVGVTTADNYPPAVDTLSHFDALPLDFEAIASLKPDLVLATNQVNNPRDVDTFEALGLPCYFFSITTLEDMLRSIRVAGSLLGVSDRADWVADSLAAALVSLQSQTAPLPEKPSTLFLIGDDVLYAFGSESYIHDLIAAAGGSSTTAILNTANPILDDEFVLTHKPEVIVGTFGEGYQASDLLEKHPTWDIVPAIQNGRVYSLPPDLYLRPGPRLVDGAYLIARLLHPALFSDASPGTSHGATE